MVWVRKKVSIQVSAILAHNQKIRLFLSDQVTTEI